jgi:hypothetical protein
MSAPENFLTRWSRRKHGTQESDVPEQPGPAAEAAKPAPDGPPADKPKSQPAPAALEQPAFDPATLPSLDSIGAQTDISAFLKPGVPGELRLAALRRAWTADPAIRDFKGLAENDWDFTKPNSMFGFGELDPGVDIKKMLAQMFSETPRADEPHTEIPAPQGQPTPPSHELGSSTEPLSSPAERTALAAVSEPRDAEVAEPSKTVRAGSDEFVQRDKNIATQNDEAESAEAQVKRRRSQGSALPE